MFSASRQDEERVINKIKSFRFGESVVFRVVEYDEHLHPYDVTLSIIELFNLGIKHIQEKGDNV